MGHRDKMKGIKHLKIISILISLAFTVGAMAEQRLEMEGTAIVGNKELPKVLYIVPWKSTETVNFPSPPIESIMEQTLKPLERNAFRRQIRYHSAIFSGPHTNQ
jgi:hypothetical protein